LDEEKTYLYWAMPVQSTREHKNDRFKMVFFQVNGKRQSERKRSREGEPWGKDDTGMANARNSCKKEKEKSNF